MIAMLAQMVKLSGILYMLLFVFCITAILILIKYLLIAMFLGFIALLLRLWESYRMSKKNK